MIPRRTKAELTRMADAARIVAECLDLLRGHVRPGVTTGELDRIADKHIRAQGAEPAFKGYHGYPATICASVNEEVVHGIPSERALEEGDIISIDVGAVVDGFYGDGAETFPVGTVDATSLELLRVTQESLDKGIEACVAGGHVRDIGAAIQKHVEDHGFSVVRSMVGHGIGKRMHEKPEVPNFAGPDKGPRLQPGMVLAIEPMVNVGRWETETLADQWTVVTRDGSRSAHFEHTVAVTENGPWVLTTLAPHRVQ